ncbi:MAG: hypothetical protein U0835_25825 [Isosphaeraceae bacterium]
MPGRGLITEIQTGQPLLIAIRGLRESVVRFAEERRARAVGREPSAEETPPAPARSAYLGGTAAPEPAPTAVSPKAVRPSETETSDRAGARRRAGFNPRPATIEPQGDHPAASTSRAHSAEEPAAGSPDPARPEDARQRLEALARLLDRRVRQSPGSPSDSVPGHEDA